MDRLELAQRLADAATAVQGVAGLAASRIDEIVEYGAGGRVRGVALDGPDDQLEVSISIAAQYSPAADLQSVAEAVRNAVRQEADRQSAAVSRIDVVVADLVGEGGMS